MYAKTPLMYTKTPFLHTKIKRKEKRRKRKKQRKRRIHKYLYIIKRKEKEKKKCAPVSRALKRKRNWWENTKILTALNKAKAREKQKRLASHNNVDVTECNADCNADVTECNADRIEREREKEILTYQLIVDMFNEICVSFSHVTLISDETVQQRAKSKRFKIFV